MLVDLFFLRSQMLGAYVSRCPEFVEAIFVGV